MECGKVLRTGFSARNQALKQQEIFSVLHIVFLMKPGRLFASVVHCRVVEWRLMRKQWCA
jgi:hypothetical protein